MRSVHSIAAVSVLVGALLCAQSANDDSVRDHIIALERGALDRWGKGDPQGFLDIMSLDESRSRLGS